MSFSYSSSIFMCYIEWSSNPEEYPMLMAVSILSPVSTHTLMPAFFMNWIVSLTPSYNLSSMAVDPSNSKSYSIYSLTLAISSSLFFTL